MYRQTAHLMQIALTIKGTVSSMGLIWGELQNLQKKYRQKAEACTLCRHLLGPLP